METLTEQLHSPEVCEEGQNGSVTVDDLDHIQRVNRDLEQQLSDKNRVRHDFNLHFALRLAFNSVNEGPAPNITLWCCFADHQAAAAETGRVEENSAERAGEKCISFLFRNMCIVKI